MAGGGGRYFPKQSKALSRLLQQTQQQQDVDIEINDYLHELLAKFNARDVEKINEYLEDLVEVLGSKVEIDKINFGGSLAKHTYVDGLSDVDALVVLDSDEHGDESPQELIARFHQALKTKLSRAKVESIDKGRMAVTIAYDDGTEIQLLPAKKKGDAIAIPNPERSGWKSVDPRAFREKLTAANDKLNGLLVPTIKLFKAAMAKLPEQQQISGYHAEALCLKSLAGYHGPPTLRGTVQHAFEQGAQNVLSPIADVTGQSGHVDEYLGGPSSTQRMVVHNGLHGLARRLKNAPTTLGWKATFE